MLRIHPFRAVRPAPGHEARIAAPPYDVVDTTEARAIAAGNPECFLHVSRAEIDFPDTVDPYSDQVYRKARHNFDRLQSDGLMIREKEPCLYIYRQTWQGHTQTGVICCCHVDDYHNDLIKKHEKTRKVKEDDRTRHTLALDANSGPVFMAYRDQSKIDEVVIAAANTRPLYHFRASDGVTHTVWSVTEPQRLMRAMASIPAAYVADGHHRAASAARAGAELRSKNPGHTGDEEYNWFLSVLFPASQLRILPYHRIVRDLNGQTAEHFLQQLRTVGDVAPTSTPEPARSGECCLYLAGQWYILTIPEDSIDRSHPIDSLDVSLLQDRVLSRLLDIGDPRTDERIDFVGGIRGTAYLAKLVDEGRAEVAFSMFPTTIEQLLAVADAGMVMPPKSTWFEPKLRSGLVVHTLDSASA